MLHPASIGPPTAARKMRDLLAEVAAILSEE
jgi:hypothetical protein